MLKIVSNDRLSVWAGWSTLRGMVRDLRQTWWSFEVLSRSMPWAVEHWAVLPASPPNAFGHNRRRRRGRTDHTVNQQHHHWPPQPVVSKDWKGVRLLKKVHFITRWLNTVWEEICLFNYDSLSRYEILLELSVFSGHGSTVTQRWECTMPLFSQTSYLSFFLHKLVIMWFTSRIKDPGS